MTVVNITIYAPSGSAAAGSLTWTPVAVSGSPTLPSPQTVTLSGGSASLTVTPNDSTWVWQVSENLTGLQPLSLYVNVPNISSVSYAELVKTDPISGIDYAVVGRNDAAALAPSAVPTVTSAAINGSGDLILTRTDTTTVNAGSVIGSNDTNVSGLVNNPASATSVALTAAYSKVSAARPGNKCVWFGDSLTQWQDAPSTFTQRVSLGNLGSILSNQRIRYARNAGIGGNTTAQMLSRFDTDVTPYAPNVIHLLGGTNDTAITVAATMSNIDAIVAKIRGIGAVPVLGTLPPKTGATTIERTRLSTLSAAIQRYSERNGIIVVDYRALFIDPATGAYLAAYQNDNTHPNDAGFTAMGQLAANTVGPLLPAWAPPLCNDNTDPNNLVANGLAINGSGIPSNFTGGSAQTGLTRNFVTNDSNIKGSWYQTIFDGTTASAYQLYQNVATAPVPGHTYLFAGKVKTTWTSGANAFTIRNQITAGASTYYITPMLNMSISITDGTFYIEYVCPVGATSQQISIMVPAGINGTIQWAQMSLYDLTAMGIA